MLPTPILTYHQIADPAPKGTPYRSLTVSPRDFARQMRLLSLLGYRGLSMTDLLPYLSGEKTGKVFGITFDDGYLNNFENALPVLQSFGFTSTCYVVSDLVGKTNVWDREVGIPQVKLMDWHHLRQWIHAGQEVGAHTKSHVHLTEISKDQQLVEIQGSKFDLESMLQCTVTHFCYPYGSFDSEVTELVKQSSYLSATTTVRGRCKSSYPRFTLPRVPVLRTTTLMLFWWKVVSSYEDKRCDLPLAMNYD